MRGAREARSRSTEKFLTAGLDYAEFGRFRNMRSSVEWLLWHKDSQQRSTKL